MSATIIDFPKTAAADAASLPGDDLMQVVNLVNERRSLADHLAATVLRNHIDEIPMEHAQWLAAFFRAHMAAPKYRLWREGWSLPPLWPNVKKPARDACADLDDEFPF